MKIKERMIREIEGLPEDLVEEAYDFVAFIQTRREACVKRETLWGDFSLSTGAFDFWDDPEEVEYSKDDLKRR